MISLGLSPQHMYQSKEDVNITLSVDDTFTGIMQGAVGDEGEGCTLSGECVLQVQRPIKAYRVILFFEGRCKVHLKEANGYGMASISGTSETRSIYNCQKVFLGQAGKLYALQPGVHTYQFSFDLPSHLPASFQGERGYIRYRLTCAIYRPMFTTDLRSSLDIPIKRCLAMSDLVSLEDCVETVHGTKNTTKIQYSGTATTMAYREGGQIRLNLAMQLLQPEHYSIKSVTWALKEQVQYRTTYSQSRTMATQSDDTYPLGFNTFYPHQAPDYDPTKYQSYNVCLRVIPRVHATTHSQLIRVTHSMEVKILLQQLDGGDGRTMDESNKITTYCQSADASNQYTQWLSDQMDDSELEHRLEKHAILSAPSSKSTTTTTPPPAGQSLPSNSFKSMFSLKNTSHDNSHSLERKTTRTQGRQRYHANSIVVCPLEIPVTVTSRCSTLEAHLSSLPPSYNQSASGSPPGYLQSVEFCPLESTYNNNDNNSSSNNLLEEQ